mmetsp:Transcript_11318/g.24363  ORF Transcript_11318/g.24363 Transcript_11318/m.24363 type:complete len:96 (+) Transcript_11318:217-504(+)
MGEGVDPGENQRMFTFEMMVQKYGVSVVNEEFYKVDVGQATPRKDADAMRRQVYSFKGLHHALMAPLKQPLVPAMKAAYAEALFQKLGFREHNNL